MAYRTAPRGRDPSLYRRGDAPIKPTEEALKAGNRRRRIEQLLEDSRLAKERARDRFESEGA